METVREVMEDRMKIAVQTFVENKSNRNINTTDIGEFAVELTEVAFSTAGISRKEQQEDW